MGEQSVFQGEGEERNRFIRSLLNDVKALDIMLREGMFETGIQRIGAEQEFCLVDKGWRPAPVAMSMLDAIDDDHFTTELAQFNLECNLDPLVFSKDSLTVMENQLRDLLEIAKKSASDIGTKVLLTGILPSIRWQDLGIEYLTPKPRYRLLNDIMRKIRGEDFEVHIQGMDEIKAQHDNIMFEACCTSFQIHLQVEQNDFPSQFNWAQAISGPVLAGANNSAILLGKRLWHETRIALFSQSVDLRSQSGSQRERHNRVSFGQDWCKDSVLDILKDDIMRYKLLFSTDLGEDALETLEKGGVPKLKALMLHNGTIYKWNRPCYGITNGKPHLRIENRYIPAGPTVADEFANMAFWLGIMRSDPEYHKNLTDRLDFDDAKDNFLRAAKYGLGASMAWLDGKTFTAGELILKELLPLAQQGLAEVGIDKADIDRNLDIIKERVESGQTGSKWMISAFNHLKKQEATVDEAILAVTAGTFKRQTTSMPVHQWDLPKSSESGSWRDRVNTVEQIMTTDLVTVQDGDLAELVAHIMDWRKIHHVPVENDDGEVVGLITAGVLVNRFGNMQGDAIKNLTVGEIMVPELHPVSPETSIKDALAVMREKGIGCLLVTKNKKLVGIVTEYDFSLIAEKLLEELEDH